MTSPLLFAQYIWREFLVLNLRQRHLTKVLEAVHGLKFLASDLDVSVDAVGGVGHQLGFLVTDFDVSVDAVGVLGHQLGFLVTEFDISVDAISVVGHQLGFLGTAWPS